MNILSDSLMVATRTETDNAQEIAPAVSHKGWDFWRAVKRTLTYPFRLDRAFNSYNRFKSMDVSLLMDVGLTQADVDRANFREFIKTPQK